MNTHNTDFYTFLSVKIEKLVTAVYMVTNFLSDKEPVKWRLRDVSLSMLPHSTVLNEKSLSERSNILSSILSAVGETLSLLEIAYLSGFISEMNYAVLKREFVTIADTLRERDEVKKSVHKISLPKTFFDGSDFPSLTPAPEHVSSQGSIKNNAGRGEGEIVPRVELAYKTENSIKDTEGIPEIHQNNFYNQKSYSDKNTPVQKVDDVVGMVGKVEKGKNKRREMIVQILKDKSDLTIKDIASEIADCSEKTIQRELISLLKIGTIKKTGERRWSRYSINN